MVGTLCDLYSGVVRSVVARGLVLLLNDEVGTMLLLPATKSVG